MWTPHAPHFWGGSSLQGPQHAHARTLAPSRATGPGARVSRAHTGTRVSAGLTVAGVHVVSAHLAPGRQRAEKRPECRWPRSPGLVGPRRDSARGQRSRGGRRPRSGAPASSRVLGLSSDVTFRSPGHSSGPCLLLSPHPPPNSRWCPRLTGQSLRQGAVWWGSGSTPSSFPREGT